MKKDEEGVLSSFDMKFTKGARHPLTQSGDIRPDTRVTGHNVSGCVVTVFLNSPGGGRPLLSGLVRVYFPVAED